MSAPPSQPAEADIPTAPELRRIARPVRLSEEVSVELQQRVARGELKPGDRLPTEKALGEAFGVSRAVVREAIARLKADGLIETRQGSGAFVVEAPKAIKSLVAKMAVRPRSALTSDSAAWWPPATESSS